MFSKLQIRQVPSDPWASRKTFAASGEAKGKKLVPQVAGDTLAAMGAGFCVAPIIYAVDRALAENASGKADLVTSFVSSMKELVVKPAEFFGSPAFRWIWLVYGSTYFAANMCDTWASQTGGNPAGPKFVATTGVNMTTCILKDQAFARMYGGGAPKPTPMGSYACWFLRDATTMGIVFSLPTIVGPMINPSDPATGTNTAQILMPIMWQPVSTPLHLLGYEIYNHPEGTVADRIAFLKSDYFRTVGIRIVRMAPPWSFGTIANRSGRERLHEMLGA
jgi:hypothetical protein